MLCGHCGPAEPGQRPGELQGSVQELHCCGRDLFGSRVPGGPGQYRRRRSRPRSPVSDDDGGRVAVLGDDDAPVLALQAIARKYRYFSQGFCRPATEPRSAARGGGGAGRVVFRCGVGGDQRGRDPPDQPTQLGPLAGLPLCHQAVDARFTDRCQLSGGVLAGSTTRASAWVPLPPAGRTGSASPARRAVGAGPSTVT